MKQITAEEYKKGEEHFEILSEYFKRPENSNIIQSILEHDSNILPKGFQIDIDSLTDEQRIFILKTLEN